MNYKECNPKWDSLGKLENWAFIPFLIFIAGFFIYLLTGIYIVMVSSGVVYLYVCSIFWIECTGS